MLRFTFFRCWCLGISLGLLVLGARPASAQVVLAPSLAQPADFMTILVFESQVKSYNKLLFAPAFKGRTEIELEGTNTFTTDKAMENQRHNAEVLSQTLSELSAAGWDLVEVHSLPWVRDKDILTTRYLLRKAKK